MSDDAERVRERFIKCFLLHLLGFLHGPRVKNNVELLSGCRVRKIFLMSVNKDRNCLRKSLIGLEVQCSSVVCNISLPEELKQGIKVFSGCIIMIYILVQIFLLIMVRIHCIWTK